MDKNNKAKLFPIGWKLSDLYPTKAEYTKAKMQFFKENHNGWYVYRGVHSEHVPDRFKDNRPNKKIQRFTYDVDVDEDGPFIIKVEKEPEE